MQTIWFLTKTVELCLQQCKSLQEKIRFTEIRSFSSRDKVENWRSGDLWEAALKNVGVAVATYEVLLNGLSDGYLKMHSIPLIVFDEGELSWRSADRRPTPLARRPKCTTVSRRTLGPR